MLAFMLGGLWGRPSCIHAIVATLSGRDAVFVKVRPCMRPCSSVPPTRRTLLLDAMEERQRERRGEAGASVSIHPGVIQGHVHMIQRHMYTRKTHGIGTRVRVT
jgi:hypothetical protein